MKKGDRIELVAMPDDPCPIPAGTQGTVQRVSEIDLGDGPYTQVSVAWDNGRTLQLVMPPDQARVVPS